MLTHPHKRIHANLRIFNYLLLRGNDAEVALLLVVYANTANKRDYDCQLPLTLACTNPATMDYVGLTVL